MIRVVVVSLLLVAAVAAATAYTGALCPDLAAAHTDRGWQALRRGDAEGADAEFEAALERCGGYGPAVGGEAYVALRAGDLGEAAKGFRTALTAQPSNPDFMVGAGITAWRQGEFTSAYDDLKRAQRIAPHRRDVLDLLAKMPDGLGPAPARPPLELPDSIVEVARLDSGRIEIHDSSGWHPVAVRPVAFGGGLEAPRWESPADFPHSGDFLRVLELVASQGANAVSIRTLYPPSFYEALRSWNGRHGSDPLWLIQGLGNGKDEAGPRKVIEAVHGRADVTPTRGRASGFYLTDVSRWTIGYMLILPAPAASAADEAGVLQARVRAIEANEFRAARPVLIGRDSFEFAPEAADSLQRQGLPPREGWRGRER